MKHHTPSRVTHETDVTAARVVVVAAREPHLTAALRYLDAESELAGVDFSARDSSVTPWGALVVTSDDTVERVRDVHPDLAFVAVVPLERGPGDSADSTADRILARFLHVSRRVIEADALVRDNGWRPAEIGPALHGSSVALVGDGPEVEPTARRLRSLSCAVDRYAALAEWESTGVIRDWVILLPSAGSDSQSARARKVGERLVDARDVSGARDEERNPTHHALRRAVREIALTARTS